MPANCWGPSVGARAISYKHAVILGLIGQAFGLLVFGPEVHSAYGSFLDHREQLYIHPLQTMYALTWSLIIPLIWQLVATWQKIVMPMYLATGKRKRTTCHRQQGVKVLRRSLASECSIQHLPHSSC